MKRQRTRWLIAAATVVLLVVLLGWQQRRSNLIAGCVASGGAWNGRASQCIPIPGAPILQRDLRRS